ncbi:transcriptional regulator, LysR family [Alkaliphilus metalliredigens QYMF]|uniref:Transcriptional regulator, LysR family n=1 Tax=Alkaliphilus metalliredigens (strain QYMF) TaxID=293826 RepID=A6TT35_ALKMQ|nr:LysR family transcriptional regulator [Alkaliphilus metalliredigens]ABR49353.1 transcriptional regulator, LysR family [Alkaliphilus metalliredigens QYMF]
MNQRELLYIKAIADTKSISKAAKKLFIAQPSLSQSIQKIEEDLGLHLFKRTNQGMLLTYAGEKYYLAATQILKIYNDFEMEISYINDLKSGRITIGITNFLATHLLPTVLPDFKKLCPNIQVLIQEKNSTELENTLINGEIDFAIMHMPVTKRQSSLLFDPIDDDPFLLATEKNHPLSRHAKNIDGLSFPSIDLKLFKDEPFIVLHSGKRIGQVATMIFQKADIIPNIVLTLKNFETARRLASTGIGSTFIPYEYSKIFGEKYQPSYFYIDQKYGAYWTTCIATSKNMYVSKASKLFIDLVKTKFGNEKSPS